MYTCLWRNHYIGVCYFKFIYLNLLPMHITNFIYTLLPHHSPKSPSLSLLLYCKALFVIPTL